MFLDPFIIVQFIQKNPTRWNSVSKFYLIFIWSSTCFGRHTAHHQEPKTALAVSGFAYVEGCWTCGCWTLSAFYVCKTRGCCAILGSWWWAVCRPKHVWASCKYGIINFDKLLHLVGFFCMYCTVSILVLPGMLKKIEVFWDVTPCRLVNRCRRYEGTAIEYIYIYNFTV